GKTLPQTPVRVELTGPDGGTWTWGPDQADNRISGPALDFCLLVTQRRHRNDLAWPSRARPPSSGWRSPRPSRAQRAPAGPRGGPLMTRPVRIANFSGFYGDRP